MNKMQKECQYCHKTKTKYVKNMQRHYSNCEEFKKYLKERVTKNFLENLYIDNGNSIIEIQERIKNKFDLEVSYGKIKLLLEEYQIPLRNISEANKMPNRNQRIMNTCIKKYR